MGEVKERYTVLCKKLGNNEIFSTPRNNDIILAYLKAKMNGGYKRLVFNTIGYRTVCKKATNLKKIDDYFKKDFDKITEDELIGYRDKLNDDKIFCDKYIVVWKNGKPTTERKTTLKPLSMRTKMDYRVNFIEFYKFMMEYLYHTENKELGEITKFFKLRKPSDYSDVIVNFIPNDELITLFKNIRNTDFKSLVQLSIMSGARPIEIIHVKYGKEHNLYKNSEGKWVIHLPKMKRMSFKKYPFVVDMYEEDLVPFFDNLNKQEGDLVFRTTDKTFRKLMKYYSLKYLNKSYSPKILRKTARMIRSNAGYKHDWINKLMGHSPNSKIQSHYTNYDGIEIDPESNERLKEKQYPNIKKDYENLKLRFQAQEERLIQQEKTIKHIQDYFMEGRVAVISKSEKEADEVDKTLIKMAES